MRTMVGALLLLACVQEPERVGPPPASLGLSPFYRKHLDAAGIPVLGSEKVSDAAILESKAIVVRMTSKRPDVLRAMIERKTRVAIMARTEVTTDVPEHADLPKAFPKTDWNRRCRGVGATPARPACSGAEENVLQEDRDGYRGESILIHEFGHSMLTMGVEFAEPAFKADLVTAYKDAIAKGLYRKTYAATNVEEYWAEGVQDWFDANRKSSPADGIHNEIATRDQLKEYDPALAGLLTRVFGDEPWRWTPRKRNP
jgi:hypothetical protein